MRRAGLIGAAVAVAITGLVVGTSPAQTPGTETITAREGRPSDPVFQWIQATRPHKVSAGDVLLQSVPLRDLVSNDRVGVERLACTVHFGSVDKGRNMLCAVEILIRTRGTVEAQGIIHLGDAADELAITGGTGDFNDVAGTLERTEKAGLPKITINLIHH